jgi:hypothetical protein
VWEPRNSHFLKAGVDVGLEIKSLNRLLLKDALFVYNFEDSWFN